MSLMRRFLVGLAAIAALAVPQNVDAQTVTEFVIPTGGSQPFDITKGPDGALWFVEQASNKIGRITTSGSITEFPIPTPGSMPTGITSGPDGALWFTELFGGKIGRITTSGTITEFTVPTPFSGPFGITTGPDGALWFAEFNGNRIGRVTTGGSFSEFPIPTSGSQPTYITTGPDGALWFSEFAGNKIGRITISGGITEFPLPPSPGGPQAIVSGPDGALWFTEFNANRIGRITTAGAITEFQVTPGDPHPTGITVGPDGALWFTESANDKIGRITTAGVITETTVPTAGSGPRGITLGPDGALWFTELTGNKIGRVSTPAIFAAVSPNSRARPVGQVITLYALVINAGAAPATNCSVALPAGVPATLHYQTVDSNLQLIGTQDTPANIPGNGLQGFALFITANQSFTQDIAFVFNCTNTNPAPIFPGINTFLLNSGSGLADLLMATAVGDPNGFIKMNQNPSPPRQGFMAVNVLNIGPGAPITFVPSDTPVGQPVRNRPLTMEICEIGPGGTCINPPSPAVNVTLGTNQSTNFGIFVTGQGQCVNFDIPNNIALAIGVQGGVPLSQAGRSIDMRPACP